MNLRDLEYVVAVAEEEHFGRASERCHVSQPALSGQIIKLEDRLGVKLFERTNRRVAVTPVGAEIVVMAKRLLVIADEIESAAAIHADPLAGRLRLGTIPTIGPYLLPTILPAIREALPKVTLSLSEDMTADLERRLVAGDIDAAITATPIAVPGLAEIVLYDEPFRIAVPAKHVLAKKRKVDVRELDTQDLLLLKDGHCLSDQIAGLCGVSRNTRPSHLDTQASSLETVIGLVAAGEGMTLLPVTCLLGSDTVRPGIVTLTAENPEALRRVRLIYRETYPKRELLGALSSVISGHLPDSVRPCKL